MYLLAYLLYKNIKHVLIEKEVINGKDKLWFLFDDTDEVRSTVTEFMNNRLIQDYLTTIVRTKILINQSKYGGT